MNTKKKVKTKTEIMWGFYDDKWGFNTRFYVTRKDAVIQSRGELPTFRIVKVKITELKARKK